MLFNSLSFAVFLPLVFGIYWLIGERRIRLQNLFIVVASYVFYGWWDWKFLLLITFTSLWAWASGIVIDHIQSRISQSGSGLPTASNRDVNFSIPEAVRRPLPPSLDTPMGYRGGGKMGCCARACR